MLVTKKLKNPQKTDAMSDPCGTFAFHQRKEPPMAKVFEFSDGFDAVAWHLERMARADHDDYYEEDQG
jgi:CDP-glycerol glycerophosphotransferase (TagB/SpsB family)